MRTLIEGHHYFEDATFPFYAMIQPQDDFANHAHDFTELVVVLDGNAEHVIDDRPYPLCSGDVFVVNGSVTHGYRNTKNLQIVNILLGESIVQLLENSLSDLAGYRALFYLGPRLRTERGFKGQIHIGPEELSHITNHIAHIISELQGKREGYKQMVVAMFQQLLIDLCRKLSLSSDAVTRELTSVGSVIGYLNNHFNDQITLQKVQELSGMPLRTFLRQFRRATGLSPIQYLIHVRVANARSLLIETDKKISWIAGETGFDDSNYFSRQFRRIVGLTPLKFRERNLRPNSSPIENPYPELDLAQIPAKGASDRR